MAKRFVLVAGDAACGATAALGECRNGQSYSAQILYLRMQNRQRQSDCQPQILSVRRQQPLPGMRRESTSPMVRIPPVYSSRGLIGVLVINYANADLRT